MASEESQETTATPSDPSNDSFRFCSVLNVVIDHSMEDPTPMESEEYHNWKRKDKDKQKVAIKVPVVRIFGPILRDPRRGPLQSACLYVHGAFPYLIARPVVAGPDGSLRRAVPPKGQINWDDAASVETTINSIHSILEDAIQALDMERKQEQPDKQQRSDKSEEKLPLIRRITLVQGRGFFTYCPGPPAPFLRIEYFDPKLRWKVKMILERGLQVPLSYFPDAQQYDRDPQDNGDVLCFHCYEAHIPYTMQFFKDWNLAGMSYVHIRRGQLRPTLRETCLAKYRNEPFDKERDLPAVFLRSNTPTKYVWPRISQSTASSNIADHSSDCYYFDPNFDAPAKGTIADVEIDCTVHDLQNIDTVLKTLPSDLDERDQIQWRAVPSLQEIWRQERRRMSKLLPPEKDFLTNMPLSQKPPQPFTLNVKQGAERSGTKLAAKGMKSLVQLTYGLDKDFERALGQILERHQQAIQQVDEGLLKPQPAVTPDKTGQHEPLALTPNIDEAINALASLDAATTPKTPSLGDAVNALEALQEGNYSNECSQTPLPMERCKAESTWEVEVGMEDNMLPWSASQPSRNISQRLSYPSSQEMHEDSQPLTILDTKSLSQFVDRGDSVFQDASAGRQDIDDYIDAETLLPYNNLDFGLDRCRVQFTVDTDPPGTTRICGNLYTGCRREGHSYQDDHERAPSGNYKTVTTGTFVDGIMDTSRAEHDEEEEDEFKFEQALSMLATQIPRTSGGLGTRSQTRSRLDSCTSLLTRGRTEDHDYSQAVFEENGTGDMAVESDDGDDDPKHNEAAEVASTGNPVGETTNEVAPVPAFRLAPPNSYPAWVTPATSPPNRGSFMRKGSGSLHPTTKGEGSTPHWLTHISKYMRDWQNSEVFLHGQRDSYIQPVQGPPPRRKVQSWCRKRGLESQDSNSKRRREGKKSSLPILGINSNSSKIVAASQGASDKISNENQAGTTNQFIEEVDWHPSQLTELSMSQVPQKDGQAELDIAVTTTVDEGTVRSKFSPSKSAADGINASQEDSSDRNTQSNQQTPDNALHGIGAQGGRIHVQGGGTLKAKTNATQTGQATQSQKHRNASRLNGSIESLPTPLSFMSIEVHVQCRTGTSRLDSKKISMAPDSNKDKIFAIVYVYGIDPGGGESMRMLERCCLFVRFEHERGERYLLAKAVESSMPQSDLGVSAPLHIECLDNEKRLLLRLSSLVTAKDPDMLLSWDTQGAGLGYIIERGIVLGVEHKAAGQNTDSSSNDRAGLDMVRLLGRTPFSGSTTSFLVNSEIDNQEASTLMPPPARNSEERKWKGSGLGNDWDERVGAGAAAASIAGRLIFSGWKVVSEEVKHPNNSYLPAVVAVVMNKRIPHHDDLLLTRWYSSREERWRVLHHRLKQATATMLLFDALDIMGRAGEASRLSGVEFSQSFPGIRGSQYKVEGVLLRALQSLRSDERGSKEGTKKTATPSKSYATNGGGSSEEIKSMTQSPWKLRRGINEAASHFVGRHYFFFSPSLDDTNRQEALEVQALTLEPESGHYTEPVVVCDFTALYPSLVIAYNLCYSTCAGKLEYHSTRREMQIEGRTSGRLGPFSYPERRTATVLRHHFKSLQGPTANEKHNRGYIAPTGTMYVGEDVLKGVLPQVLDEILTTRAMLKRAAKEYRKNVKDLSPAILRQLEARQLALKYVANVTYGYTSATFSGRCAMPLLADTIVECGRKTLRKAIDLANRWGSEKKWRGAKVVYGDTDSLFVKLPGRTYKEAFDFGEELCRAVTAENPPPVQLKLEKVYLGSIMQTMKRYCGMKFESKNQKKPVFEAKGLETLRKDQCALTQKVLRNTLITLFQDGIAGVKDYLYRQWSLIETGRIPVADFILTGRVRSKYRGGKEGPVQAVLAKRIGEADPGRIVRHKERLPFVIVATPGITFRLKDCVLTPLELLERWDAYTIHSAYYIERHVNASLQRCLGLAPHFADVNAWYQACPKSRRRIHFWPVRSRNRAMITTYFGSDVCSLCHQKCQASGRALVVVCSDCRNDETKSAQLALSHLNEVQVVAKKLARECSSCNGCFEDEDTFASLVKPDGTDSRRQKTMDMISGGHGGECLRLPLANCVCIDCPNTFKRHHLREQLIEATATCEVLNLL